MAKSKKKLIRQTAWFDFDIPFWTWVTTITGISGTLPDGTPHKVQLTPGQTAIWKSYDRKVPLTPEEAKAYEALTGLPAWEAGSKAPPFKLMALTRGGGKTMLSGCLAVYEILTSPYRAMPGEGVCVIVIAPRVSQANRILGYAGALCQLPGIAPFLDGEPIDGKIRFKGGREIVVAAADQEGTAARSYTALALIVDECAFLSPNEDDGIFEAASASGRGVDTFKAVLCSSVNGKAGLFYEKYKAYFGVDNPIWEIFHGEAGLVYPKTLDDPDAVRKKIENIEAYKREYLCDFEAGSDAEKIFSVESIQAATRDIEVIRPRIGSEYAAAIDASSMVDGGDSFVFTIVSRKDTEVEQCYLKYWNPNVEKLELNAIVEHISSVCTDYGIDTINGDAHGGKWIQEIFLGHGLNFDAFTTGRPQKLSRANLLKEMLESGRIHLLQSKEQYDELRMYEKTVLPSGTIVVNKSPGGSDDAVDCLGLALDVLISNNTIIHPPEALDRYIGYEEFKKDMYEGGHAPRNSKLTYQSICAIGPGPKWVISHWDKIWRFSLLSIGELAALLQVGPYQLVRYLGEDVVLQHTWMRWLLSKLTPEQVLQYKFLFPKIKSWGAIKARLASGQPTVSFNGESVRPGGEHYKAPKSWTTSMPISADPDEPISMVKADRPWTSPPRGCNIEPVLGDLSLYTWWPQSPNAAFIESIIRG